MKVIIVGAGISGLTLAAALAQLAPRILSKRRIVVRGLAVVAFVIDRA